jgi:23S rRNA pseudouridine2605 synthase
MENNLIRLQLFLSRAGVASRRKAEELIREGKVFVDGECITEMGYKVKGSERIVCDKKVVKLEQELVYILLNKPKKYLSANSDDRGRRVALDLVQNSIEQRLFHVGRLDYESSGLLLFTNDGNFGKIVSHPSSQIEKEYLVETREPVSEELLKQFKKGIKHEGEILKIAHYEQESPTKVKLILKQGKNREIRRLFETQKIKIRKLHRIRIGALRLTKLAAGQWRYLTKKEVDWFLMQKH